MLTSVRDLSGLALDYAVAKALGAVINPCSLVDFFVDFSTQKRGNFGTLGCYGYCRDWSLAGPIIEANHIDLESFCDHKSRIFWEASIWDNEALGPTPIIAAMRVFVLSYLTKSGDKSDCIDVPDQLLEQNHG